jgi:hypothetical protein
LLLTRKTTNPQYIRELSQPLLIYPWAKMKKPLLFIFILLMVSCTKDEIKLEAFGPEAFAYDLGDTWEVNALVNVRGFEQREHIDNKSFVASIILSADIKKPDGTFVEGVFADTINVINHEEILDIPLDVQFGLDSNYPLGSYQIIIHITNEFSKNDITTTIEFDLTD